MCTDEKNALPNIFTNILKGDIEDMVDVEEDTKAIERLKNRLDWMKYRLDLHTNANMKRNVKMTDRMDKVEYDIANTMDKIDELEWEILQISQAVKDFIAEGRTVIQDLDKDIRKLL